MLSHKYGHPVQSICPIRLLRCFTSQKNKWTHFQNINTKTEIEGMRYFSTAPIPLIIGTPRMIKKNTDSDIRNIPGNAILWVCKKLCA